jgi:hypothetical protein
MQEFVALSSEKSSEQILQLVLSIQVLQFDEHPVQILPFKK